MTHPDDENVLEVHGLKFVYDGDDVWLWEKKEDVWKALPELPSYLVIVGDRLALMDPKTGRPKCNCDSFQVNNFGCKCGGV